ncbi:hypothetical protein MPSI1_002320 [Malassezia psittaci]|uniref:RRM domain-containing protein n=1 Tax=Malassezia psittaci TaxID=1821823 RepID=A0AAF0F5V9_9BASI|nr:hypothetical protein MPSI1_002320 [Malassezia psittaci]
MFAGDAHDADLPSEREALHADAPVNANEGRGVEDERMMDRDEPRDGSNRWRRDGPPQDDRRYSRGGPPRRDDRRTQDRRDYGRHDHGRRDNRGRRDFRRDDQASHADDADEKESNPGNNLHVSSLARDAQDADLEALFAPHGTVVKAQIVRDPHTNDSRGFGFVTLETVEEATAALNALNGHEFMGRSLVVQVARRGRARASTPGQYLGPSKRRGDGRDHGSRRDNFRGYDRERGPRRDYDRPRYDRPRYDRPPRREYSPSREAPRNYEHHGERMHES